MAGIRLSKYFELMGLKKDYMGWLDNQSAGFLEANNKFAEMSKPINQMKVGQALLEKNFSLFLHFKD